MLTNEHLRQIADDPKGFLNRNYRTEERIRAKRERIAHLHSVCTSITQEIKDVVAYTGPTNKLENCITEVVDLEAEILEEIKGLTVIQQETQAAIQELLDDIVLIEILERRYLNGERWEGIAVSMNYAYRWVMRLHNKALKRMKKEAMESAAAL